MNTTNLPKNDFSIVFDKMKQYNKENSLSSNDFLNSEEIRTNEEIRDFEQICQELNAHSNGIVIYQTFY
jgi:hypothetical protein